jgi:dipeptidase E
VQFRNRHLLLISNSTMHGKGYLDHAEAELRDLLGDRKLVLFIPFALYDRHAYTERVRTRLGKIGYRVQGVDELLAGKLRLEDVDAIFVGGGNTFRLLKNLYDCKLLEPVRQFVASGRPYIGSSAGSIVAGPSIKTSKDMPIVEPPSFRAFALVDFQISPHYLDPDSNSTHMGESQEERIQQFLEENDDAVIGLREGSMLRVEGDSVQLKGLYAARVFRRNHSPLEMAAASELAPLLELMETVEGVRR